MHDATVIASLIAEAFADYHAQFAAITRRARRRFEQRDWSAAREDAVQRIALYDACINECRLRLQAVLGQPVLGAPYHWVQTPHYLLSADRWDDRDALHAAVMATAGALPCPKPRKPKAVAR